jgi:hypothetical protein
MRLASAIAFGGAALLLSSIAWTADAPPGDARGAASVKAPMICSRGSDAQFFRARVTLPEAVPSGSVYTVRIDSVASATISGTGLNYLHDMLTDYFLPAGASYVPSSARIVGETGTENVRAGARAFLEHGFLRFHLPGHVENGSSYTPPSLEFQLLATAPAGSALPIQFVRHRLSANVFLLGNLDVVCTPSAGAVTIGTTRVTAPLSP